MYEAVALSVLVALVGANLGLTAKILLNLGRLMARSDDHARRLNILEKPRHETATQTAA